MLLSAQSLRSSVLKCLKRSISEAPYAQNFRSSWPLPRPSNDIINSLPKRTISEDAIQFEMQANFERGVEQYYDHHKIHPQDYRVKLYVKMKDLGLNKIEQKVLMEMVGPRYNVGKMQLKLVSEIFPHRLENRKYLVYQLECLLAETRKIAQLVEKEHEEKRQSRLIASSTETHKGVDTTIQKSE